MENNYIAYKRVKINWWMIVLFVGLYTCLIFAYIHQRGNNPIGNTGLIIISII